jgi:hypothetical protein
MKPPKAAQGGTMPAVPAAEALSFLKDTKGVLNWTTRALAETLCISAKEAEQVLAVLEIQGYVKPVHGEKAEWLTTPAGEAVSGSKAPRFSRASVEKALAALSEHIAALNRANAGKRSAARNKNDAPSKDSTEEFRVSEAVAFGDFLGGFSADRARVQAADVGIQLVRRELAGHDPNSAVEQAARGAVMRQLRDRSALLNLRPYEAWMSHRSHQKLL